MGTNLNGQNVPTDLDAILEGNAPLDAATARTLRVLWLREYGDARRARIATVDKHGCASISLA